MENRSEREIAYSADFFQSQVPRTKQYPVYLLQCFSSLIQRFLHNDGKGLKGVYSSPSPPSLEVFRDPGERVRDGSQAVVGVVRGAA